MTKFVSFIRDLFDGLPSPLPSDWKSVELLEPNKPTIVLVSGFGANFRTLSVMRKRFLKDGFNVLVVSLNWQMISDSIRGLSWIAERLSHVMIDVRRRALRDEKIFLVAHSAGGLVARYYIHFLGGDHYCDGLVTMATPHKGTWLAGLGFFTHLILKFKCLLELLPNSKFIEKLEGATLPKGFGMLAMHSKRDTICPPSVTLIPEGLAKDKNVKTEEFRNFSHKDFLLSKICYRKIYKWIESEADLSGLKRTEKVSY